MHLVYFTRNLIVIVLVGSLATHVNASIKKEIILEKSTSPKQFCFNDTLTKGKKLIVSNKVLIQDIDEPMPIEIKGSGEYSINGRDMKRESAMVNNGDSVQVRHYSLEADGAKVSTVLVVGDTYDVFTTTTQKELQQESIDISSSHSCRS